MNKLRLLSILATLCVGCALTNAASPSIQPAKPTKELIPTEDPLIPNFHCLGLIEGRANIFRSANPVRDLIEIPKGEKAPPLAPTEQLVQATGRMKRLHDLGIRTVFCFQHSDGNEKDQVALEQTAAATVGITVLIRPLSNSGKDSFEDMDTPAALKQLMPICDEIVTAAKQGGVLFHCKAGHDRTGVVAALLRVKFQKWSADQAVAEMRRLGHSPNKYSHPGSQYSWLETHVINAASK